MNEQITADRLIEILALDENARIPLDPDGKRVVLTYTAEPGEGSRRRPRLGTFDEPFFETVILAGHVFVDGVTVPGNSPNEELNRAIVVPEKITIPSIPEAKINVLRWAPSIVAGDSTAVTFEIYTPEV